MRRHFATTLCLSLLATPLTAVAQPSDTSEPPQILVPSPTETQLIAPDASSFWAPFAQVPRDVKSFMTTQDTLKMLGPAAVGALFASTFDQESIGIALSRFQPAGVFTPGNIGGGFYAQTGGALAVYTIGHFTKSEKVRAVGSDLVRSQILTQFSVQTVKFAMRRERPDNSDRMSLPSGHSAGTFATATVLQKHFGWKVGIPAYIAGAYVATSRMSANKHHLSDVIMGAAFGMAAARTVTVGSGPARFKVNVAPTAGGGVVTFTKP